MAIVVKGMTVPALLVKLDENITIDENVSQIKEKLSSDFFKGSLAVIDYDSAHVSDEDRAKLESALKNTDARFMGYKKDLDLKKSPNAATPAATKSENKSLMVINKNIRNGQSIEHESDVLIIGDVNPGAYVTASGNILVMGALKGIVHAGAGGDDSAMVLALELRPQQLRIAGHITRSPDDIDAPEYPEKAYIRDDQMYIEKIRN